MEPLDQEKTLAKIVEFQSVAQTYLSKSAVLLAEYQEAVAPVPLGERRTTTANIRSLQLWTDWLIENQPAYRQTIWDATEINLSKGGYDRTQAWRAPMTYMSDDDLPGDAVLRIQGPNNGMGRPPMIYFVWSQRWSVFPLFGVGPIKPDNIPEPFGGIPEIGYDSDTLLGVVPPPVSSHPINPADGEEQTFDWPEPEPTRYATMVEWDAAWESQFDLYVATETKPTDDEKQMMWDTLPDGAERNAALAIAYRSAVERSRANPSGVNWADAVDDIRSEADPT